MRVIVNARFLTQRITGVQRHALELSRQLKKDQPEVEFVAPGGIIHKEAAEELQAKTIGRFGGHLWEQYDLPRYLRRHQPAFLINLANSAPLAWKEQIVTIHDTGFLRHPEWYNKRFYYWYRYLLPRIARRSRLVATDSRFAKSEIVDRLGIPEEKVVVIPCAVADMFQRSPAGESPRDSGEFILTVSSLDRRKNLERLVAAFRKADLPGSRLVIVGGKDRIFGRDRLTRAVAANRRIISAGYVEDDRLAAYYRTALFFVFVSLYEGFGLPPLEAMACGCPCLVSRAASLPEVCGEAALYCDPCDVDDIAAKLTKMFVDHHTRRWLIEAGRRQVEKFNWKKSAAALWQAASACGA